MKCGDSKPCPTEKRFETVLSTESSNSVPQVYFETKLIKGGSKVYISSAGLCNVSPPNSEMHFQNEILVVGTLPSQPQLMKFWKFCTAVRCPQP